MRSSRRRALDLFCCQGGASAGLKAAGFDVVGVDIQQQPRYPFKFVRADALTFELGGFDLIWASPPCQRFSCATPRGHREKHPDLISPIRERLIASGALWIMENVPLAPLRNPVKLDGGMFGLSTWRRRHFETNFPAFAITS